MAAMTAMSDDTCPRCGGNFHCGVADAEPCACTTLSLDADTLARLRRTYSGCLCLRCLQALSQNVEERIEEHIEQPRGDTP